METNVVRMGGAAVATRTPAGASALQLIASSGAWRIDDAGDLAGWITPSVRTALPLARHEAEARLAPATRADFKRLVAPTLALVAPIGMTEQDATAWLATAAETLRGIPADLLEAGCMVARSTADHPAKLLPAILSPVRGRWDDRRADAARLARIDAVASGRRQRQPWEAEAWKPPTDDRLAPEDVDETNVLMRRMGLRQRYRADGSPYQLADDEPDPCPAPAHD